MWNECFEILGGMELVGVNLAHQTDLSISGLKMDQSKLFSYNRPTTALCCNYWETNISP